MSKLTDILGLFQYDPETDGANTFNITQALNNNWDKIDQLVLLAVAAAAAYDPEGSYAVGDYCTHGGKLHKCGTAIPDGEAWNAAHWTETTVAAELADVRASLSNKLEVYTSFSELGLSEATANVESIITAMSDHSLFLCICGTEGYAAGWLPNRYGMLLIHKFNMYAAMAKYQRDAPNGPIWTGYYNLSAVDKWTGWVPQATATPPEVDDLPLANGVLGWARYMLDSLGNVTITGVISFTTSPTAAQQILTLPEGIRPLKQTPIIFQTSSSSSASMYGYIQPSGTIQLANNTPPTGFTQNASIAMIAPTYSIKSVQ